MDAASNVVIDVGIPSPSNRFHKPRLLVSDEAFAFGKKHIALNQVEAVAYQIIDTMTWGVLKTATWRTFQLWGGDGVHIVVKVGSQPLAKKQTALMTDVFSSLTQFSQDVIEPKLREQLVPLVAAGTPVVIGSVTLARSGMTVKRKLRDDLSISWDASPQAHFESGAVHVSAQTGQQRESVAKVPMDSANAVLLPQMLHQLAQHPS